MLSSNPGGITVADSNITKKALAEALKALMREMPIEKINVAYICERCGMKRQSFYYHFRDKYDLLNWIFDSETDTLLGDGSSVSQEGPWDRFELLCRYFYDNRNFYRSALQIHGQDSFMVHFQQRIFPVFKRALSFMPGNQKQDEFSANFFAYALVCAIARWLMSRNGMEPEEFIRNIKQLGEVIRRAARMNGTPETVPPTSEQ